MKENILGKNIFKENIFKEKLNQSNNGNSISQISCENIINVDQKSTEKKSIEKKTLIFFFEKIKTKIIQFTTKQFSTADTQCIKSIQKFKEKIKSITCEWGKLIARIQNELSNIDKIYQTENFYGPDVCLREKGSFLIGLDDHFLMGLQEMIINHIFNILISFILMGPSAVVGSGIDNCNVPFCFGIESKLHGKL